MVRAVDQDQAQERVEKEAVVQLHTMAGGVTDTLRTQQDDKLVKHPNHPLPPSSNPQHYNTIPLHHHRTNEH